MRILLVLMLSGLSLTCFSEEEIYPEWNDRQSPNGWLERSANEVTYTSHIPKYFQGISCEQSYCRKSDSMYTSTPWTKGKETKYTFDLRINKYNGFDAPEWIILFQDWMLIDAVDTNGNHPTTTIKIKPLSNHAMEIAHFENSWQFNYSTTNPIDPTDPFDYNHNHAPDVKVGSIFLDDMDVMEWFKFELTIRDGDTLEGGSVTLKINNRLVSDVSYQTKNEANRHLVGFGMYWAKGYNSTFNKCGNWYLDELKCKSTSITIRNLRIFQ